MQSSDVSQEVLNECGFVFMSGIIRMCIHRIVDSLLQFDSLFDFFGDIRIHGADHDRCIAVTVEIDIGNTVFLGNFNLGCTVGFTVASV